MGRLAWTDGLSEVQREILDTIAEFVDREVLPVATELEHADAYPQRIVDGLKKLGVFGLTIPERYGGLGESLLTYALVVEELSRGWMSVSGILNTHFIVAYMIGRHGTEEQKARLLPKMATGEVRGAFSMSEPDCGSDVAAIRTRARRDGSDWVLDGTKMWITNGSVADVAVVWARTDEGIRGFLVPTTTPGFSAPVIHKKVSLRASITSELVLDGVRLPADAILPGAEGLKAPLSCLSEARYGIVWGVAGAARACLEATLDYTRTRTQFDRPIASFQLTQRKIADMLVDVNHATLTAYQIGRLKDAGLAHHSHISFGKFANVRAAQRVAATARALHGANGITLEYPVMRHMVNLETVSTYEGTEDIHALTLGRTVTGISAFR